MQDPTRLTEQLDPDAASLLPRRVPLGQAAPRVLCRDVPMLNLTLDNPSHLTQLTLRLDFPLPPWVRTQAKKKFFSQKSPNRLEIEIEFWKDIWKIFFWILKIHLF
jgi:hypothetical protein